MLLRLEAGTVVALLVAAAAVEGSPWDLSPLRVPTKASEPDADFDALVQPLSQMSKLSYTATAGSYFSPESQQEVVAGWRRVLTWDPAVGYGMRALVFVEEDHAGDQFRTVVAFRGTDLDDSGVSGQADRCAGYVGGLLQGDMPDYCSKFTLDEMDYMVGVLQLLSTTVWRIPGSQVLFTGHSLGCTLAVMAQPLEPNSKCACFAQGGVSDEYWAKYHPSAGQTRTAQYLAASQDSFVLADSQDPVSVSADATKTVHGQECFWTSESTASCEACELPSATSELLGGASSGSSDPCTECFMEKHAYSHYLRLVYHEATASYLCSPTSPALTAEALAAGEAY